MLVTTFAELRERIEEMRPDLDAEQRDDRLGPKLAPSSAAPALAIAGARGYDAAIKDVLKLIEEDPS